MAALSKRDIEMIFRAETDAATRPVNALAADVKGLRKNLEDLTTSSNKNEKSLDALAATTRELEKAQDELGTNRALLTQLNSQAAALERAQAAADKAAEKYQGLKAQVDGAEAPTKRLTNSLAAAGRAVDANNAKLETAQRDYAQVKGEIEAIIGPVNNFQDAFRQIALTQKDVAQGLAVSSAAVGEFKREIASVGALDSFEAMAVKSPVSAESIATISQYENRVELLRLEEAALAASRQNQAAAETARKQKQKDDIESLLQTNTRLSAEINEVAAAAARLDSINAYRRMAADSVAALANTGRFKESLDGGAISAERLADSILGIINPTQAASRTLAGALDQIDKSTARLEGGKLRVSEFSEIANELSQAQATLLGIADQTDKFTRQQAVLDRATAAYDRQATEVRELAGALSTVDEPTEEMARALRVAETQLETLGKTAAREEQRLESLSAELRRVGIDSKNMGAGLAQIEGGARKAAPAIDTVTKAIRPNGSGGFLGLNPYELQNLGFQVNDVFTQLGSGTPLLQVIAQQGGQILQIFPGIFTAIAANLPIILALAVAFGGVAVAISETSAELQTIKDGEVLIARLGETGKLTAQDFVNLTSTFRDFGASLDDAKAAATVFIEQGLNPAAFQDFAVAATNMATVLGIDLKDAADQVTTAFTGNAQSVLDLDDKYGFLTDAQRDQLVASKDTKNEAEEVNKAFTALFKKMQDGAAAQRGPYSDAVNAFNQAWRNLKATFADTSAFQSVLNYITRVVNGAAVAINIIRELTKQVKTGGAVLANPLGALRGEVKLDTRSLDQIVADARKQTAKDIALTNKPLKVGVTNGGIDLGAGTAAGQKREEKAYEKNRKAREKAAKKSASDAEAEAKRRQREAEALAKQYENEQDQLTQSLSRFTQQALRGQSSTLEQELQFAKEAVDEQFKALEDRLAEFKQKFGDKSINGVSQADFAARLAAQRQAITLQKQLGVYEQNVNDLVKEREQRIGEVNEQQKVGLIGAQAAMEQIKEITSEINPKLQSAIGAAVTFIKSLTPSAETNALLAKLDRIGGQTGAGADSVTLRQEASESLALQEAKLNKLISDRNALVEASNTLYELGLISSEEAQSRSAAAYNTTNAAIIQSTESIKAFLEANRALFDPVVFDTMIAKLQAIGQQAVYVNTDLRAIQESAQGAFVNGFTAMFDTLAQGIANIITGAGSLKDLLGDLGRAALNFAAQFLKAIADAIIQLTALRIAKSLLGGGFGGFLFHSGGTVGDLGQGAMRTTRSISPAAFAAIPKYHNGSPGVGLKPNEQLAILEKGEKVSTEEQQRLEKNRLSALRGRGSKSLRQVLAFGDEQVAGAMAGNAGEDVVITHIRRNRPRIRQELGLDG